MYTIQSRIVGTAPLMQHRYPMPDFADLGKGGKKSTGSKDYTQEWRDYLYTTKDGKIYQPAVHIEGAMIKAAANFKITGKRGASYKELFKAAMFIGPDEILHGVDTPDQLDADADKPLYLDCRPVVVQRARVVRIRPCFKSGWSLDFEITVIDDELPADVVNDALILAGKAVGIGDFRPRFGRFMVAGFTVQR